MKIALCLSGQTRGTLQTWKYIKKIFLDDLKCDVFIHTWKKSKFLDTAKSKNLHTHLNLHNANNARIDEIKKIFKPKKIMVEKQISSFQGDNWYDLLNIQSTNSPLNTTSMFYSILQSYNIMEEYAKINKINYDIVIRARFDIIFHSEKNSSIIFPFNDIDKNTVLIPHNDDHGGVNDRFAFGDFQTMKIYCNTYYKIFDVYKWCLKRQDKKYGKANITFNNKQLKKWENGKGNYRINFGIQPEMILEYQLRDNDIKIKRYNNYRIRLDREQD